MTIYFIKRLLSILPKLFIITIIIFVGLQMIPGDPISRMISPEQIIKMNAAQLEAMRESLGLNDSAATQYFRWITRLIKGDLGYSIRTGDSIIDILKIRVPATFKLVVGGLIIGAVIGLIFGVISAIKKNSFIDYLTTTLGIIGISIPDFFFGLILILIFAISLGWLPTGGKMEYGVESFFGVIKFYILPTIVLGIQYIATIMLFTRVSMLDVLDKDYIKTARSKGISEVRVNIKHGFRNAMIPVMIIIMFRIPMLIGGTIVIETVFNYPGMGTLLVKAVEGADLSLVMVSTLIITCAILGLSFLADIVTAIIDPRVKFEN